MRTCADDACGEAIHDPVNDKLPWPNRRAAFRGAPDPMPGGYVVRDANRQALAYLYSRDNEAEARQAKVLTKDEARRIGARISRAQGMSITDIPWPWRRARRSKGIRVTRTLSGRP